MAKNNSNNHSGDIDLSILDVGNAEEVPYMERQRFAIGKWVLITGTAFLAVSCFLLIFPGESECGESNATKIFEFFKASVPPLITLVLGFYFRDVQGNSSD